MAAQGEKMFVNIINVYTMVRALPFFTVQLLTLVCTYLAVVVLIFAQKNRQIFVGVLIVCSCVLTTLVACRYAADTACWFTCGKSAPLYIGPGKQYRANGCVDQNDAVCVQKRCDDWICVRGEKSQGWLLLRS